MVGRHFKFLLFLPTSVFAGLWGIPYLQKMYGYTTQQAAVATGLIFIGWAIGAPIQGWLSDLFQRRLRLIWISAILSCVLALCVLYIRICHIGWFACCLL